MFGLDGSLTNQEDTADTSLRNPHPGLDPPSSSLYKELKLSEQLYSQLSHTRIELESLRRRLKESEQRKESSEYELNRALQTISTLQTDLKVMKFHCSEYEKAIQSGNLKNSAAIEQLSKSVSFCTELEAKSKQIASILHEERANFDIRLKIPVKSTVL